MKKELGIGVILLVLCIVVTIMNPRFIGPANLKNTATLISIYGIFSIGMGIVIITGGIDLSVGSAFALQGVLLAMMLGQWHIPWPLAVAISIVGMMLLGLFHGFMVTGVKLQPFIVTLCGLLFYRGAARFVTNDETKGLGTANYGFIETLSTGTVSIGRYDIPNVLFLLIGVAAIMWVVLHRSVYGRYLLAVGRNEEAARYSGINTKVVIGSAYVLSMALTGIAGVLLVFYTRSISPANHGNSYELYGIAAAVLGGCSLRGGEGSILGILLGTALLQVLQNMVNLLGIPSSLNLAVMGAVILAGVAVDQLLGSRKRKIKSLG
jgi:ribose transport system permease protein